jgi:hypothetical protein
MDVNDLIDMEMIRQALAAYARGIDRQDYDLVLSAYWPDGWDAHGLVEGVPAAFADFVQKVWPKLRMQHLMGQSYIELDGRFANVETYFVAHQHSVESGGEYVLGGRYIDRFEKRENLWKVLRRNVVYDWRKDWNRSAEEQAKLSSYPAHNIGSTSDDYSWELLSRNREKNH